MYKILQNIDGETCTIHRHIQTYDLAFDILHCMKSNYKSMGKKINGLTRWSLMVNDNEIYRISHEQTERT